MFSTCICFCLIQTHAHNYLHGLHGTSVSELAPTSGGISLSKHKALQTCGARSVNFDLPPRHYCDVLRDLASSLYRLEAQVPDNV